MTTLAQLQQSFKKGLLKGDLSTLGAHVKAGGAPAAERLGIHANNSRILTREALAGSFPTVRDLVGETFFNAMAGAFISAHPPTSGALLFYGDRFPDYIEAFTPARSLPYLADVARLEWSIHESHYAADSTSDDLQSLQALDPGDLPRLHFDLRPDLRLVQSGWAIGRIRAAHLGEIAFEDVRIDDGPAFLRVSREAREIAVNEMSAADWHALRALKAGCALEESLAGAETAGQGIDPAAFLAWFFGSGLIINWRLENGRGDR